MKRPLAGACLGVLFAAAAAHASPEVVAVLSSDSEFYAESFRGFQKTFGRPVRSFNAQNEERRLDSDTRVVVGFGAKASGRAYPDTATVIACLAPGFRWSEEAREGGFAQVWMLPRADAVLARMREIQPGLKRLGVFWVSDTMDAYIAEMRQAAARQGIELVGERLADEADLPDALRAARGSDALWLPPDPILINSKNFTTMRDFSWANRIPFYAPTQGLVEKGATASVASSFEEMGRVAALNAHRALAGQTIDALIYPENLQVSVNLSAAEKVGLDIPPDALKRADKVLP